MHTLEHYPVEQYSRIQIQEAALIIHPSIMERYHITREEFAQVFEEGSNFTQLRTPIFDEFGNQFFDSEGLYMAQRFTNQEVKKIIAFCSSGEYLSKRVAYRYEDAMDKDDENRIVYMRRAITEKFDTNPELFAKLMETSGRDIIEFTYWGDEFFGVDCHSLEGRNILGKLLMEYRDDQKKRN